MAEPKQEFRGKRLPVEVVLAAQLRIHDLQGEHLKPAGVYLPAGTLIRLTGVRSFGQDSCQDQYRGVEVRWNGDDYWVLAKDLDRCVSAKQLVH